MPEDCCERNVCTPTGVITPRVRSHQRRWNGVVLTGDYTYWTAREESLEYAVSTTPQGANADTRCSRREKSTAPITNGYLALKWA